MPDLVQYIKEILVSPWKRSLVKAYASQHLHLDNQATPRVEGSHSILKKYLQVSTGNLKTVYNCITFLLISQHAQFEGDIAKDKMITPYTAHRPLYFQLLNQILNYALRKL